MPDWFYRTVSRPLLFRLPATTARDLALGLMGRLSRLPLGPALIDFLGHMRADPRLRRGLLGITFPTPVGLGPWLDGEGVAPGALARFGVGFLEVGPVTIAPVAGALERRAGAEAIWSTSPPMSVALADLMPRLPAPGRLSVPLLVRLGHAPGATPELTTADSCEVVSTLAAHAGGFTLMTLPHALAGGWSPEQWQDHVRRVLAAAERSSPPRPVLLGLPADVEEGPADRLLDAALALGLAGALIDGSVGAKPTGRLAGLPAREAALLQVRRLRKRLGPAPAIIGAGGVHEPAHALELREAGADLIQVDTGLVYTGPGLPKRINEAFLHADATAGRAAESEPERVVERTWFWTALMGAGMLIGSLLALAIAATRVVLPYDEHFVGVTRAQFLEMNPRLLAFMTHDRVTLAGTMVAIGTLYLGLSLFGVRRGLHWAQQSIFLSAFAGFGSFFLFLGFGYFDPFHAFVTGILFQFLLLGLHARLGPPPFPSAADLRSDGPWRRAQWGQLLLVLHACALLVAGVVIAGVGVTQVFVHEDLEFMGTTRAALEKANPRLIPLVAHDRATFGGMLVAGGLGFLTTALWGFRPGSRWLWWVLLLAGTPAYAAAIGVHYAVGYTDLMHLAPAFAGLGVFLLGLGLSYTYLAGPTGMA